LIKTVLSVTANLHAPRNTADMLPRLHPMHSQAPAAFSCMRRIRQNFQFSECNLEVESKCNSALVVEIIRVQARSPVFKALLGGGMREGKEEEVEIQDVRAPVFRALLQFAYTDSLPEACRMREPHGTD